MTYGRNRNRNRNQLLITILLTVKSTVTIIQLYKLKKILPILQSVMKVEQTNVVR